jgi:plastocyanin
MKKLYTLICATALTLISINSNAVNHNVAVRAPSDAFTPNTLAVNVGDSITWIWAAGNHNVTSTSVPAGATSFASSTTSVVGTHYVYHVTVAGTYNYDCTIHAAMGMTGSFTATSTAGVASYNSTEATTAYPTLCTDHITFKYNGVDRISLFNMLGESVRNTEVNAGTGELEMDLTGLNSGIYFYATYKEGTLLETKKIVKVK